MIALEQIHLQIGIFSLVDVNLQIEPGQYGVLMGRTGCGKTTILEAVAGLRPVRSGRILLGNREVTALHPAARGVGYVPQDLALFPSLSVREHLRFALEVRRLPQGNRVEELAQLLGITALLDRRPQGLSGGEAQRVALGRALAFRPSVLLLDEPLSALDDDTRADMIALLKRVQQAEHVTVLHVTHSKTEAHALADRLFLVADGRVLERERSDVPSDNFCVPRPTAHNREDPFRRDNDPWAGDRR
jgi:ABC-type sugar transport system ATPase subunit